MHPDDLTAHIGGRISPHRKVEIGLRKGLAGEGEVPPLVFVGLEAVPLHDARKEESIGANR